MAKKAAARPYHWRTSHYVKVMLDQILQLSLVVKKFAEREGLACMRKVRI